MQHGLISTFSKKKKFPAAPGRSHRNIFANYRTFLATKPVGQIPTAFPSDSILYRPGPNLKLSPRAIPNPPNLTRFWDIPAPRPYSPMSPPYPISAKSIRFYPNLSKPIQLYPAIPDTTLPRCQSLADPTLNRRRAIPTYAQTYRPLLAPRCRYYIHCVNINPWAMPPARLYQDRKLILNGLTQSYQYAPPGGNEERRRAKTINAGEGGANEDRETGREEWS